jgi:hypothetical protein
VQVSDTRHCLLAKRYSGSEPLTSQANSTGSSIIQGDHDSTSSVIISSLSTCNVCWSKPLGHFSINGITPVLYMSIESVFEFRSVNYVIYFFFSLIIER